MKKKIYLYIRKIVLSEVVKGVEVSITESDGPGRNSVVEAVVLCSR